jgi:DNA repair photolyase
MQSLTKGQRMQTYSVPLQAIKGRGTASRVPHRFESDARERFDDGWSAPGAAAPQTPAPQGANAVPEPTRPSTQIIFEDAKSAISRNTSPDIYFDYSVNPYRGCEHGCVYCYARPTHSYLGLSPGLDFETQIIAKRNISEVLRAELTSARYVPRSLNIGSATDCYQPAERELRLTRGVIELMGELRHPWSLITKSANVERDLDVIAPQAHVQRAAVYITITTLDPELARILEPRAASPQRRLRTIRALREAGVPVGVSVAPQIPFINEDMEQVLAAAYEAGARSAFYTVLRLPWELSTVFRRWLQLHYPQRAARVMARIHDMRGGRDYRADFATRMKGQGAWANLLRARFDTTTRKLGFTQQRKELDFSQFRGAPAAGVGDVLQGQLF